MKVRRSLLILVAILFVGFFLRILFINSSPPSLYGDELTITLDAYSLLKTGHDQLGNFLPLTFPMGAGRPAGYVYGSIPFIAIFGPTALGVRALSILSGMGILVLLYLLGRRLFSDKVGLLAATIGAISPWEISLSRGGFEAHFALFLGLLGVYLFLAAREKPKFYIFSALCFGLAFHTYPTYKVSLILILPLLFWLQEIKNILGAGKKYLFGGIAILLILGVLSLSQTFFSGSESRFSDINIFSQSKLQASIEQKIDLERQVTQVPQTIKKYFHNKPVEYAKVFIENYLQNFSVNFLVLHGDRNPRHNMATMGEMYLAELILTFVGVLAFWQKQKKVVIFLMLWVLLAPVPSAFVDLPHALRSSFMLPPILILSALGLAVISSYKNKILLSVVLLLFVIQFAFFIQKLYFLAPNEYSSFWSYPAKLASEIAIENKDKYSYIILSDKIDSLEFAYPVYAEVAPEQVIYQNKNTLALNGRVFKEYGNVYIGFVPDREIESFLKSLKGSVLYIGSTAAKDYLGNFELIEGKDKQIALILKRISQ